MIPTIDQIKAGIGQVPIHPTHHRISQGFGLENTRPLILHWYQGMGMLGHNGIDYACPTGTILKAPIDFTVSNLYYENIDQGYGTTLWGRSQEFVVNGQTYAIELIFGHLSEFVIGTIIGKNFTQGEDCAISGNTGKYTTGSHLHIGFRINEKTSAGGWLAIDKDNGYKGYFNQLLLMENDMFETIKIKGRPEIFAKSKTENVIYWVGGWNSYQRLLKAGWAKPFIEVESTDAVIIWEPFGWLT